MRLTTLSEDNNQTAGDLHKFAQVAAKNVPDLWEPYEEKAHAKPIVHDKSQWTEDYLGNQYVYLDTNFSKERFNHVIEVRDHLKK